MSNKTRLLGCIALVSAVGLAPVYAAGGKGGASKAHPATSSAASSAVAPAAVSGPKTDPLPGGGGPSTTGGIRSISHAPAGVQSDPLPNRGNTAAGTEMSPPMSSSPDGRVIQKVAPLTPARDPVASSPGSPALSQANSIHADPLPSRDNTAAGTNPPASSSSDGRVIQKVNPLTPANGPVVGSPGNPATSPSPADGRVIQKVDPPQTM